MSTYERKIGGKCQSESRAAVTISFLTMSLVWAAQALMADIDCWNRFMH